MTLLYNRIQRRNPQAPDAPKKWYPVLKSTGPIDNKEMGRQLADETTINAKEAELAIYEYSKIVLRALLNSQTVPFGDLGYFYLTANTTGADTEAEATAANIGDLNLRFRPSKDALHELSKAEFAYIKSLLPETKEGAGEAEPSEP